MDPALQDFLHVTFNPPAPPHGPHHTVPPPLSKEDMISKLDPTLQIFLNEKQLAQDKVYATAAAGVRTMASFIKNGE